MTSAAAIEVTRTAPHQAIASHGSGPAGRDSSRSLVDPMTGVNGWLRIDAAVRASGRSDSDLMAGYDKMLGQVLDPHRFPALLRRLPPPASWARQTTGTMSSRSGLNAYSTGSTCSCDGSAARMARIEPRQIKTMKGTGCRHGWSARGEVSPIGASGTAPESGGGGRPAGESEPDARFTFANERTFLAWTRTALAFVVAGLAIVQLLPPFPGVPWGRHLLGVPLIVIGAVIAIVSYSQWVRSERALRRGEPLPPSLLPRILAITITAMAAVSAVVLLVSAILKPQ
jgi:putative membrane protein